MPTSAARSLDETVRCVCERLKERNVPAPDALFLLATGMGQLPDHLLSSREIDLGEIPEVPEPWRSRVLVAGRMSDSAIWILEDAADDPLEIEPGEAWVRGLPLWIAAACGAALCVHTSAGSALVAEDGASTPLAPVGGFALVRDHLNVSGATPLVGLGGSTLGPLFPDQTRLHHLGLRRAALQRAEEQGIPAAEVVAACTAGPALETPAERRMLARLGAEVAVQSLAWPLLAAVHAGLSVLSIVVVTDAGGAPTDVARLVETAADAGPALEDLLVSLIEDVRGAVRALEEEGPS